MSEWISVEDRLPRYGDPVILCIMGVTQNITYCRDGHPDGSCLDWFEPVFFNEDDEHKIFYTDASHWQPLPTSP